MSISAQLVATVLTSGAVLLQDQVHPQTIAVCQSRADGLTLTVEVVNVADMKVDKDVSGVLLQYPASDGSVHDYTVMQTAAYQCMACHHPCCESEF